MEVFGYLAALTAATCWALASLVAIEPVRQLGAIPFNAIRMLMVALMLSFWLVVTDQWLVPDSATLKVLALSGFIGIFLGDTLLFMTLKTLGPRLTGLLFATNAPISFLLGIWLLDESYSWLNLLGVLAVCAGVFMAIASRGQSGQHAWEQSLGHVGIGIATGFGAALCQSLGTLIVFDTMRAGQDPVFATMVRVWIGVVFLFLMLLIPKFSGGFSRYRLLTVKRVGQILGSGTLGIAVGMSLILWAVHRAPLGIVAILSATTPVIVLPLLWIVTGERPKLNSLIAASIVVSGTAIIFITG